MDVNRRNFLRGAAVGAAGTALTGGLIVGGAVSDSKSGSDEGVFRPSSVPFHGVHQAGIVTPVQQAGMFAAFDVLVTDRAGLTELFKTLTARARFLTSGGAPEELGVGAPPSDNGIVGPVVPTDGLTVTLSVGSSLFDDRFGLGSRRPKTLSRMEAFPNDALKPEWCHGDLMVQICGNRPDIIHHALRDITKYTRGAMQLRWRIDGFQSPPRPAGTPRNLMGFKDGTANPPVSDANDIVWITKDSDEPEWAVGGSYQVVRPTAMFVEFWDRVSIGEQELMFGRKRDSGAPLDGVHETDEPNYRRDPKGAVIPLDSHIRLANPRTKDSESSRILRRPFNYDRGIAPNGNLDAGLIFCCYQQDIERQFITVQKRLIDEPLVDYIQPFGGGYFFALPGVRNSRDYYGRSLLAG